MAAWVIVLALLEANNAGGLGGKDDDNPPVKRTRCVVELPDCSTAPWLRMLGDDELKDRTSRAARNFSRRFRIPCVRC